MFSILLVAICLSGLITQYFVNKNLQEQLNRVYRVTEFRNFVADAIFYFIKKRIREVDNLALFQNLEVYYGILDDKGYSFDDMLNSKKPLTLAAWYPEGLYNTLKAIEEKCTPEQKTPI